MYPSVGTFVLIRPAQTFCERIKLEMEHRREVAAHKATKGVLNVVHVIALVLLVLLIGSVLLWWFVLR